MLADAYASLPADREWCDLLLGACHGRKAHGELSELHHSDFPPVVALEGGKFYPVIIVKHPGFTLACLPLLDDGKAAQPPAAAPAISVGLALLQDLAQACTAIFVPGRALSACQLDVHNFLSLAMPFGTPALTDRSAIASLMALKPNTKPPAEKVPAWKPLLVKTKPQIQLVLRERVAAAQYDKASVADVSRLSGVVSCKADLEGLPEVAVVLHAGKAFGDLVSHACVSAVEGTLGSTQVRLRFSPPSDMFELCHYQAAEFNLPIRGFYQLKNVSHDTVKWLLQLKLSDTFPNSFEHCDVYLPFRGRGRVKEIEGVPTCGSASVAADGHGVVWRIGAKFVGKQNVVAFPGVIHFHMEPGLDDADPFCVGLNAYAQLSFRMIDCSAIGATLDAGNVSVLPPVKAKVTAVREVVSDDYRIWNSLGQARHCLPPPAPTSPS